jgi:hypothetical protein
VEKTRYQESGEDEITGEWRRRDNRRVEKTR